MLGRDFSYDRDVTSSERNPKVIVDRTKAIKFSS